MVVENSIKRVSGMVRIRGGFSDDYGVTPFSTVLQITEFDNDTRMRFSNVLYDILETAMKRPNGLGTDDYFPQLFCSMVIGNIFHESIATTLASGYYWEKVFAKIHEVLMISTYNEVLDVIQYLCGIISKNTALEDTVYEIFNGVFETEYVGYRFIDGRIAPITDAMEIESIEEACKNQFEGCRKQIQKAVGFLSDRDSRDYKNCIKESISAVESICQVIVEDNSATLGEALKKLEDTGVRIHPSLKLGFQKLYGYTSDQGGIRHAEGMFESNVTFEEAKYMLVSCCAFINYLIGEYAKKGN